MGDYEDILRQFGLLAESETAKGLHYRKMREPTLDLDRRGVPCIRHRDLRCSDEWQALQAAIWSQGLESVAEAAELSFSRIASALKQQSPWHVRHFW